MLTKTRSLLSDTARDVRTHWKTLALTDITYKIIAFIVLAPLVGVLFRVLLAMSGSAVLSDQDILYFFLGPVGWVCFIVVGAVWLGIVALEQAALLRVLCGSDEQRVSVLGALTFARRNAWPVFQVTARLLALTLLTVAPFLVVAGLVYLTLLGEFDINYYLKEKPPEFLAALGVGVALIVALIVVLLRLFTGWFYALPLVLFEETRPRDALRASRLRADGHRRTLLAWIVGWFVTTALISAVASAVVLWLGRMVVPRAVGSLELLALAIGVVLLLWFGVNLLVNLLSTTTFAAMLLNLYKGLGSSSDVDLSWLRLADANEDRAGFQITRTRLALAGIAGGVLALAVGVVAIRSVHLEDRTTVTAHRGSSKAAPENTMAAVRQATEDGADWVEIDVQETADGEVVVFHDSDFMKLAGSPLKIWDATADDLKELDIGSWYSLEFKDQRVPTLAEVLKACKGKAGVNIELKYYGHDEQLEQRVVDIVESHDMADEIVVMSLKMDAVKKMKALRPDWKVGLLMSVSAGDLASIDADFLAVNAAFANRRFVRDAHDMGKEVFVWTVNDAPTMSVMIGRGVDSLITDKPALARKVLDQRARMSPGERLLLELAGAFGMTPEIGEQ